MKKLFQYIVLLFIFLFTFTSQSPLEAQESTDQDQQSINIKIINQETSLEIKHSNGRNFYYYHIRGEIEPTTYADRVVYLVLKKNDGPKKILVEYSGAIGRTYEFPIYTGRTDGYKGDPVLVQGDFLTESGNYKYYFTADSIDGAPISRAVSISTPVPSQLPNESDVVTKLKITPKKNADKNYYHISGYINDTKPGKNINFLVVKEGESTGEIIGEWKYKKGNFTIPADNAERDGIGDLSPGKYILKIVEIGGAQLQPDIKITKQITKTTSSENIESTQNNAMSSLDDPSNEGLVKTNCGYELAPGKGGRICNFSDLMGLISRVIDYIFVLILPIAAIIFAYAGYLYITSGGSPDKRTAAKKAMTYLVVGIVVIMMAWLLVKTVLVSLGVTAGFTLFLDI